MGMRCMIGHAQRSVRWKRRTRSATAERDQALEIWAVHALLCCLATLANEIEGVFLLLDGRAPHESEGRSGSDRRIEITSKSLLERTGAAFGVLARDG